MTEQGASAGGETYSERLGALTAGQIQAALARFGLGELVEISKVSGGLFGQNVFIASTQGRYVLRGAPHYPWQFPKERLGAALLHQHTAVPVAHPYMLDESDDIFGWPYILMPRLRGARPVGGHLSEAEQVEIARALGKNLAQMHTLEWSFAGEYELASNAILPFRDGYPAWLAADVRRWLALAAAHGDATTAADVAWVEQIIREAQPALAASFKPCFVMNDYNPGNVLVDRVEGAWRVTGLFDLMEYYFGDGEADLMRMIASYLDSGDLHGAQLARAFGAAYLERRPSRQGFARRYALYMLRDRLIVWEYGTRPGHQWFPPGWSLRDYAERYMASAGLFEQYMA